MVVSGSALATAIGVQVLEQGGNAVDAAAATAFALAVVEPSMSGIGGRTQMVLRTAGGEVAAIDGTTEVPAAYTGGPVDDESAYGWSTVAVPGTVAALAHALRSHGTWPLARVMQPAIELAARGFILPEEEARRLAGVAARLRQFAGSRAHFLKSDGRPYSPGERFVQPDLARTLRMVAAGGEDAFYRGEIARRIVADSRASGGLLADSDLASYRAEESIVVRGRYRGHELIGSYLPASGATSIEILQILDHLELRDMAGTADWVSVVAQASLHGFEDRVADRAPPSAKAAWLTSRELAATRAAAIRVPASSPREAARNEARARPLRPRPSVAPPAALASTGHEPAFTTHLSVADRWGGVVALTQSVGPTMGSKVATEGLGFVYAATMGYLGQLEPGTRRHWSSQSPLLVMRDGRPLLVLGGAGSRRIISGVVQSVSRFIDQQLPLEQALAGPRFHPTASRIDIEVRPGTAWSAADVSRLEALGFNVEARDDAPYFARINAIAWDAAAREWVGVADPRWPGTAAAPAR